MSGNEMRNIQRNAFLARHPEVAEALLDCVLKEYPFNNEGSLALAEFIEKRIDREIGWA